MDLAAFFILGNRGVHINPPVPEPNAGKRWHWVVAPNGTRYWLPNVTNCYYGLAIVGVPRYMYSRFMIRCVGQTNGKTKRGGAETNSLKEALPMKRALLVIFAMVTFVGTMFAKELPEAPSAVMAGEAPIEFVSSKAVAPVPVKKVETKVVDLKFASLAVISTGSTFADSFTTMFATQNWNAGKQNVCNAEVQTAYLYGTHPTTGRVYAVASAKAAGSIFAAYYLRKHHNRFWSAPLIANAAISLQGVTQNMRACN